MFYISMNYDKFLSWYWHYVLAYGFVSFLTGNSQTPALYTLLFCTIDFINTSIVYIIVLHNRFYRQQHCIHYCFAQQILQTAALYTLLFCTIDFIDSNIVYIYCFAQQILQTPALNTLLFYTIDFIDTSILYIIVLYNRFYRHQHCTCIHYCFVQQILFAFLGCS